MMVNFVPCMKSATPVVLLESGPAGITAVLVDCDKAGSLTRRCTHSIHVHVGAGNVSLCEAWAAATPHEQEVLLSEMAQQLQAIKVKKHKEKTEVGSKTRMFGNLSANTLLRNNAVHVFVSLVVSLVLWCLFSMCCVTYS